MPLPRRGIVPFAAAAMALGVLLLTGWLTIARTGRTTASSNSSSNNSNSSRSVTVTRQAGYRRACKLFQERKYPAAIAALDTLGASPILGEADRVFLRRQREICLSAASGKVTSVATIPSSDRITPKNETIRISGAKSSGIKADCGPRALLLLCQNAKLPATLPALSKMAGVAAPRGTSLEGLSKAAKAVGFAPEAIQMDRDALANLSTPAIAWVDGNHYVAVYEVKRSLRGITYDSVLIQDPNKNGKETLLLTDLLSRSGGVFLTLPQPKLRQAIDG